MLNVFMNTQMEAIKRQFFVLYLFIFSLPPLLQVYLARTLCQSLDVGDTEVNNADSSICLKGVYIPRGGWGRDDRLDKWLLGHMVISIERKIA